MSEIDAYAAEFTVRDNPIQEHFDDSEHWARTTLIIPGGINIE
jgi:hypothetical protein